MLFIQLSGAFYELLQKNVIENSLLQLLIETVIFSLSRRIFMRGQPFQYLSEEVVFSWAGVTFFERDGWKYRTKTTKDPISLTLDGKFLQIVPETL